MEKIITEVVPLNVANVPERSTVFTFPEIQRLLDEGFSIKQIFYTPIKAGYDGGDCISLTVHLQKADI